MIMQFSIVQSFLFIGLLSYSLGDLDFDDCGSEDMAINILDMEDCIHTPCHVARGDSYKIFLIPEYVGPLVDSIDISARALIRGAAFEVPAFCDNPCILRQCPLEMRLEEPVLEINVLMHPNLLRGPAPLILNATYTLGGVPKGRFCVRFDIEIN